MTTKAPKIGLEPRGAALAVVTGACIAGGYALVQDFDMRRTQKATVGGSIGFFGAYLFLRGSRFDDVQTAAVVAAVFSLATIMAVGRSGRR